MGNSVDDILGSHFKKPIFMVNPLVLQFCLWLLTTEFFGSRRTVYDKLLDCAAQRIDIRMLDIDFVDEFIPAMDIRKALHDEDSLKLEFLKQIFENVNLCTSCKLDVIRYLDVIGKVRLLILTFWVSWNSLVTVC